MQIESASPPRKRKPEPSEREAQIDACSREIRAFLWAGVPGFYRLSQVFMSIKDEFHKDDDDAWAESCRRAFQGYGRDVSRRLANCQYDLSFLRHCGFGND